ncbi:MtrB/PioB family outer membrane beta-barrel protein [Desulfosediminicola ganghwensis]|uniref:MtrB/PioB family outer membrane beta-barrel protein n=1 Tax=Desulfosediminicola ganghwensis TaxID=2569540 RepID=UPI00142EDF9B|nr:MtrB/PioB family outer membrane beta-barrel protein [Desulfosediminicola ganghwensis]
MKKRICVLAMLSLCWGVTDAAAAGPDLDGYVEFGGRLFDVDGDEAKFNEYRDIDNGVYGNVDILSYWEGGYYIDFLAENIAYDDQAYWLNGGRFGSLKYSLYYDEIIHNITEDALTPYDGIGSDTLVGTGETEPALWNSFDYKKEREKYGGDVEYAFENGYFVQFGASNMESSGVMPYGGTSSAEFPAPIDWEENQFNITGGYRAKKLTASLTGQFINFDNEDDSLTRDDTIGSLPPDNDVAKVLGKMVWRPEYYGSVVALNAGYSKTESDEQLGIVVPGETRNFDGEITKWHVNGSWKFEPIEDLDLKLLARYDDRDNDSTELTTLDGNENENYSSEIFKTGIEADYKLSRNNRIDGGYHYLNKDYEGRSDSDGADDNLFFIQARNYSLEDVELRAKYSFLTRSGDYTVEPGETDEGYRSYDVADQDRNQVELEGGYYGVEDLGLDLEFTWFNADYDDTEVGLVELDHYDLYFSGTWAIQSNVNTGFYVGFERDYSEDLGDAAETTYYTYAAGLNIEAYFMAEKLRLYAGWDWAESDGKSEFDSADIIDTDEVEDFTQHILSLKGTYFIDEAWSVTLGYVYEEWDYSDDQWNNYVIVVPGSRGDTFLSGAYDDQDYEGHTGYLSVKYKF